MKRGISFKKSMKLFAEASKYLPAGASSNARLWHGICPSNLPCSIFAKKAVGSHIWDVDGNKYIDYRLGFGPVILGHSYPAIHNAVHKADKKGLVYALDNELEIVVAKKICKMVKCAKMIRFANSGTEATMSAVRIARGFTKKEKIIKFEGHYHGAHDYVLFSTDPPFNIKKNIPHPSSLGIPKPIKDLVIVREWNNFDQIEKAVKKHHKDVAAIIAEPVMGNAAVIPPRDGYLKHLRELCDKYDIILIFDEVKTGFRLAKGGAQEIYKVIPDISTYSKSIGNGYPIAAVAGEENVMSVVAPQKVLHGGTFSSNPVSLTAANATLDELNKEKVFKHLNNYGRKLIYGIREIFSDNDIDAIVQGFPQMFHFLFTNRERIYNYRELRFCNFNLFADIHYELLRKGIMIDEDNEEPMFICYSHNNRDLNDTLDAFEDAVKIVKKR